MSISWKRKKKQQSKNKTLLGKPCVFFQFPETFVFLTREAYLLKNALTSCSLVSLIKRKGVLHKSQKSFINLLVLCKTLRTLTTWLLHLLHTQILGADKSLSHQVRSKHNQNAGIKYTQFSQISSQVITCCIISLSITCMRHPQSVCN